MADMLCECEQADGRKLRHLPVPTKSRMTARPSVAPSLA